MNFVTHDSVRKWIAAASILFAGVLVAAGPTWAGPKTHDAKDGARESHMSDKGAANTNSVHAPDRDTGRARAEERMNEQGRAHGHGQPDHGKPGKDAKDRKDKRGHAPD